MKIKRVYIPAAGEMLLQETELDERLKPTEVLVRTTYSGISAGTECALYMGWGGDIFPTATGGSNVGEVVATGAEVTAFAVGDHITSFTNHDSYVKCETLPLEFGFNSHRSGVVIPPALRGPSSALVYHFAVGMSAVRESAVTLGDDVLVVGGGLIGLTAAQLFRAAGASVMLADLSEPRLALARRCGIDHTVNSGEADLAAAVRDWTDGRLLHHVVVAVPNTAILPDLVDLLRVRGNLIMLASYRREATADIQPIFAKLQTLSARVHSPLAWRYPIAEARHHHHSTLGHYRQILRLIADGRLTVDPLITLVDPADCHAVFQDLVHRKDKYLGAVFDWSRVHGR